MYLNVWLRLLAMGLMEYNTDWKAIQQRFLPCKSKHQIFVRQKNRCSSKAPENPIKAVRRMKTSPLTAEEKAHIHKGLKAFRHDWMSVWKFIVPYRDPSLLPRQWRVALGTQKSYKTDAAKKEKRRLYLAQKKLGKAAPLVNLSTASEKEDIMDMNNSTAEGNKSEDDNMEDEDEAYVHEAFLADWRPRNSRPASSELAHARLNGKNVQPGNLLPQEHFCASGIPTNDWNGGYQPEHIYTRDFFHSNFPHDLHNVSHFTHVKYSASYTVASNHFSPNYLSKPSKSQVVLRPRRVRKKKDAQSVKLAPGLPPVNLPPSVRVVSQSAFKSYHCVTSHSTKISTSGVETENLLPSSAHVVKSGMGPSMNAGNRGSTQSSHRMANNCSQEPRIDSDDNIADTGLQLHPLLLQSPEDGQLPHRPVNTTTCVSNTLNFMERNHRQANFSHICKPTHAGSTVDGFYTTLSSMDSSKSCGIDFHPLLQRRDVSFAQLLNSSDPVMSEPPPVTNVPQATAPIPASPSEDAEELDLEIHLSSTSRKKKVTTERKVIEQGYNGSRGLLNFGILKQTDKSNNFSERVESFPVASLAGSSRNDNVLVLSNNRSFTDNCVGDQSHPEIVMEQEELSDSEEENGDDVEFECEEMDDSEREESDCG
ncbi:Homeodomain-like superfamily protein [Thalictrum thalictroides]|uniref:Homeodomain-like superfamily protein n=1 Tax=Thalictrum thalictroides TaxID=46969 RepID=A0A7J6WD68_THATH|nr:Homeodomain-like superfamily protein [Thalictrum thalictroides]